MLRSVIYDIFLLPEGRREEIAWESKWEKSFALRPLAFLAFLTQVNVVIHE